MRFGIILAMVFGIVTTERAPDETSNDEDEEEVDPNTHVMLEKLKDFYHPQYGEVHQSLLNIARAQEDSNNAAQTWTDNSFRTLKEAHMLMTKSTQDTQNVLMSDTMRVNDAIRYNFKDEMAKIDAMSLDESAREKILKEQGLSVVMPPGEFENDFNGRRVRANNRYNRDYATLVHNKEGKILSYIVEEACWKVRFDDFGRWIQSVPKGWEPCLREGEFSFISETPDERAHRKHTPDPKGKGRAGKMGVFAEDPYVIVDHIPLSNTPRVAGRQWLHQICKVTSWDDVRNAYVVKRPLDPTNYMSSVYSDDVLYLLPNRDFHTFHDIAGQKVQVTHLKEGKEGLPGEAFFGRGQVVSFDPLTMKYKVKIPSQTLELSPKEVTRLKRNVLTKWIWTDFAEDDSKLIRFFLNHNEKAPKKGKEITTSQIALLTQKEHENMESLAADLERPLVQKISESGEGSWTKRIREQMANKDAELSIDFTQFKWTHTAAHAFEELALRMESNMPDQGAHVRSQLIGWLLYLLPPDSLDLRAWFGTDAGQKLYACGKQPLHLPGLYGLVGSGVKCDGSPESSHVDPDCEKTCTGDANCFFYTLYAKSGICEIWHDCSGQESVNNETAHTYRRQAICYHTGSNKWLPTASGGIDHTGIDPLLILSGSEDVADMQADVSKYEDLFGSESKIPPRDNETLLPWIITEKGVEELTQLMGSLKTVRQGTPLAQDIVESILEVPGMDIEEWFHAMHPFVVGPDDWDTQVSQEEKRFEEFRDPNKFYVVADPSNKADNQKKMVIFRTEANPDEWTTGVILAAKPDMTSSKDLKLSDYSYTIQPVNQEGEQENESIERLRWQTHWFDPRGKWKNEGCRDITAYQDWQRRYEGPAQSSSLVQVKARGGFIRKHNDRGHS